MASVCESETSVKRQKKSPAPGDEPPSVPDEVALPDKYRALRCRYCMNWSTSTCPFELLGTLLAAWHPFLPWGRGKRDKPIGDKCKLCVIAPSLMFCIFFLGGEGCCMDFSRRASMEHA